MNVTVIAVTMVQLTLEEVIDMIAMRNGLVSTIVMPARAIDSIALSRIPVAHFNNMLIIVSFMSSMKMPVMEIIDMPTVLNSSVTTMFTVNVCMVRMSCMVHYGSSCTVKMILVMERFATKQNISPLYRYVNTFCAFDRSQYKIRGIIY
jgi:hypothetical protein